MMEMDCILKTLGTFFTFIAYNKLKSILINIRINAIRRFDAASIILKNNKV